MAQRVVYPEARRDDEVVEQLHGIQVRDPYRWLEDPDATDTTTWVAAQNELFKSCVDCETRDLCLERLKQMSCYDRMGCPFLRGDGAAYFFKKKGLQNHRILYRLALDHGAQLPPPAGLDNADVFLDPNTFSEDGTASLGSYSFSHDGKFIAFGVNQSGSDWATIKTMEVATKTVLCHDHLEWAKFYNIAWLKDNSGFYYCRYPTPHTLKDVPNDNEKRGAETDELVNQAVYFHALGTTQDKDRRVFSVPEHPNWMFLPQTTRDGAYLIIYVSESCAPQEKVYFVDLTKHLGHEESNVQKFIDSFEASYTYIANDGPHFFFATTLRAPRRRVIKCNIEHPRADDDAWLTEILPEHQTDVMSDVQAVNQTNMITVYEHDVKDVVQVRSLLSGEHISDIALPDVGCVAEISTRREDSAFFFRFTSFTYPGTLFKVDLADGVQISPYEEMKVPGFNPDLYATRQVFCTSKDGTKVPIFIVQSKSAPPTSDELPPCILYGYGGFSISITPSFSLTWAMWLQHFGGVVAVANIRGGNEYGEEWHNAGIIDKKQNVFDDFIAASEHLISTKVTTSQRLCIMGGSNGGTLVGACVNQRPDLYGAAIAKVGVMDMLRFHKFTIGAAWTSDFGDPDNSDHFPHIWKYSPYHNVFDPDERGTPYPSLLLTTASHDDRVVPLHSFKYAAEVQHKAGNAAAQKNPLLIRVYVKTGHGGGKPTMTILEETSDLFAFLRSSVMSRFKQ